LNDKDEHLQVAAINSLGDLKDSASVGILENMFRNRKNTRVRGTALLALGEIEGKAALPIIEEGLKVDSRLTTVKLYSLFALQKFDSSKALTTALDFVKYGEEPSLRIYTLYSLDQIGLSGKGILDSLKVYLLDSDPIVRYFMINMFGRFGGETDIPLLEERVKNEAGGQFCCAASEAIRSIKDRLAAKETPGTAGK